MSILVVGSVAYDDVETPSGKRIRQLGGSAVYFSTSASYFAPVSLVGVVGSDFSDSDKRMMAEKGIDISGLETAEGETFRWSGRYMNDINTAETLDTRLNVFENFMPKLSEFHKSPDALFLANIAPSLQLSVLERINRPRLIGCDTMNLWISQSRGDLKRVISPLRHRLYERVGGATIDRQEPPAGRRQGSAGYGRKDCGDKTRGVRSGDGCPRF